MSDGAAVERGYVYHGRVNGAAELGKRLSGWFVGEKWVYFAAFRPDGRQLGWFNLAEAEALTKQWEKGRVFSRRHEARWQRVQEGYDAWLLAEEEIPPAERDGMEEIAGDWQIARRTGQGQGIYLWGRYDKPWSEREGKPTWVEARIPGVMHYPAEPPVEDETNTGRLFVRVGYVDYRASNGAVQFTRLVDLD